MLYPLTTMQNYFYEYQKKDPDSTMYNMYPMLMRLHDWIDLDRLADSILRVNEAHPAVESIIEEHNGVPMQRYIPGLIARPSVERISEDEFMSQKDKLVKPFYPGEPMFRFRIFQTEKAKYLFSDTYHIVCDATSKCIYFYDLDNVYSGQNVDNDAWLTYLQEKEAEKSSPHYDESRKYFEAMYDPESFSWYPEPDFDMQYNREGELHVASGISENELDVLKKCHLTRNEFFTTAALIATALFNRKPSVMHTWFYHGRIKKEFRKVVGLLTHDMPAALHLEGMTLGKAFTSIRTQVKGGLKHIDYPYDLLDQKFLADDTLCVIYQGSLYDTPEDFSFVKELLEIREKHSGAQNIFDIEILENDGGIDLLFFYAAQRYKPETVEAYSEIFVRTARRLLEAANNDELNKEVLAYV